MSQDLVIRTAALPAKPTGVLAVYVGEGDVPGGAAAAIWASTGLDWPTVSAAANFTGKAGHVLDLPAPHGIEATRLLVLGAGRVAEFSPTAWADRGGSLMAKLIATRSDRAAIVLDEVEPRAAAELAAGLKLRHYRFDKYKTRRKPDAPEEPKKLTVTLHVTDKAAADRAIADRLATADGTLLARELVNEPPNILGTVEFAQLAAGLSSTGLSVEVLEEPALKKLGMGSLLAVSRGSVRPPRLVIMQWNGGKTGEQSVAFIGKGVVFDSGGISIKPAASMEDMKGDMGGAAAVTGLMQALATRKAKVNAIGVIGLVENMPDADATRPGDIITAMSGTTIEVVNTDAEGRLVLADALWYTQQRFKPRFMINLATLTGAIVVALGKDHAGLFSNNDELAARLLAAGLVTGEKLWRMPLSPTYDKMIESRFADIRNSTGIRHAGAVTAAQFLQRFVNDVPWAHLDIAGVSDGAGATEINTSWGSGFGVALLDRLVRDHYEA